MDWQTFTFFAGLLAVWAGLILGVIQWMLNRQGAQLDQRMGELGRLITKSDEDVKVLTKDFMSFKTEVARDYVRREDWIRTASVLEAKIDGVLERLYERN